MRFRLPRCSDAKDSLPMTAGCVFATSSDCAWICGGMEAVDVCSYDGAIPGSPIKCQMVIDMTDSTATMMPAHIHLGFEKREGTKYGLDGFSVFFGNSNPRITRSSCPSRSRTDSVRSSRLSAVA